MTTLASLVRTSDLESLRRWLTEASTLELAGELARLPPADRAIPFRSLPKDRALAVFSP
jgi:magnesium transporter